MYVYKYIYIYEDHAPTVDESQPQTTLQVYRYRYR